MLLNTDPKCTVELARRNYIELHRNIGYTDPRVQTKWLVLNLEYFKAGQEDINHETPQGGVITPLSIQYSDELTTRTPRQQRGAERLPCRRRPTDRLMGTDSTAKMQDSVNIMIARCEEIGFTISQTRTKTLAKTRSITTNKLQLKGQEIKWMATPQYLGIIVAWLRYDT